MGPGPRHCFPDALPMPRAYLLAITVGSSLDQPTNNVTLFQLVEQVNVAAGAEPPPNGYLPLELHCYFHSTPEDLGRSVDMRFALVSPMGLETLTEPVTHRLATGRFRTRTVGLPYPPALGHYELCVDFRRSGAENFERDALRYPISFVELSQKPTVTH
jgi:hypothetical protein